MLPLQGGLFAVGQNFLVAVGFVGRCQNNLFDLWAAAAGFQHIPCAGNVGLKGGDWVAVGDGDNGLRRQVHDGVNFVLAQNSFDKFTIPNIAAHDLHLFDGLRAHQFALGNPIAHQTDDIGAGGG